MSDDSPIRVLIADGPAHARASLQAAFERIFGQLGANDGPWNIGDDLA